jgi:hypothetical protein
MSLGPAKDLAPEIGQFWGLLSSIKINIKMQLCAGTQIPLGRKRIRPWPYSATPPVFSPNHSGRWTPSKEIASPLFGQEGNVRLRVRRSRRDKAIGTASSL